MSGPTTREDLERLVQGAIADDNAERGPHATSYSNAAAVVEALRRAGLLAALLLAAGCSRPSPRVPPHATLERQCAGGVGLYRSARGRFLYFPDGGDAAPVDPSAKAEDLCR